MILNRFFSTLLLVALCVSLPLGLSACGKPTGLAGVNKGGEVVLTLDKQPVTKAEYDKLFQQFAKQVGGDKNPELVKNPFFAQLLQQQTIQALISLAIIQHETKALNVTVTPADIKAQTDKIIERVGGVNNLNDLKKKSNLSDTDFSYQMEQIATIQKLMAALPGVKATVSDKEVADYYAKHSKEFDLPEQIRSSHILIKASEAELRNEIATKEPKLDAKALKAKIDAAMAAKKAEAEALLKELQATPSKFQSIAGSSRNEDTVAAMQKGDLGFMRERSTDPGYWAATKTAKVGELIPTVVQSSYGYHLVLVHEKQAAKKQTLADVQGKLTDMLTEQKQNEAFGQWMQEKVALLQKEGKLKIMEKYEAKPMMPPSAPPTAEGAKKPEVATKH
ncbi:MAG: peptidylprolyl isomerase [Vampirovibrionales bacterium]